MTDADKLRLARQIQFRELLSLIFEDETPWADSLPMQALADLLEPEGHGPVADAVRDRFRTSRQELQMVTHEMKIDRAPAWPVVDQGKLKKAPTARRVRHRVELEGFVDLATGERYQ